MGSSVKIMASQRLTAVDQELLSALAAGPGLVLVAGSTGQGKTTMIERVLADATCPPNVAFIGDIRGDVEDATCAVRLARSQAVLAVLRIPHAAGAFARLIALGIPASDLAEVTRSVFSTRLIRRPLDVLLLYERLVVTPAIRGLVLAGADADAVHRQAIADGMRSLRQNGLEHVRAGRLTHETVVDMTPDD